MVTPSRIFLAACFAILAGVLSALVVSFDRMVPLLLISSGGVFAFFALPQKASFGSKRYLPLAFGCVLLGAALGILRVQQFEASLARQTVANFSGKVTIRGVIVSYPKEQLRDVRFTLEVTSVEEKSAVGKVAVTIPSTDPPSYGSFVTIQGTLRAPQRFDDFNYPAYLAKDGVTAVMSGRTLLVLGQEGSVVDRLLWKTRMAIEQTVLAMLPFREAATLKALLLGDEGSMTKDFQDALNRSGLRHIVAISGMNIAIMTSVLMRLGLLVGLWRKQAFLLATGMIFFFVAMIGFPASAVRAAIMGASLHVAPILGRPARALRAVVFSATVMTILSPYILLYDVGFQLSFVAVLGMLYLEPMIKRSFERLPDMIAETLATTLAAQCAVLPLLMSTFDSVSLVAPISNLLVVPPLWLITIVGFVAVSLGIVWLPLGIVFTALLFPYLLYLHFVTELFAKFPIATVTLSPSVMGIIALCWYGFLLWLIAHDQRKRLRPIDLFLFQQT